MTKKYKQHDKPAFPHESCKGLTKREWFAGLAMQAFATSMQTGTFADIATDAVNAADALIAELEK